MNNNDSGYTQNYMVSFAEALNLIDRQPIKIDVEEVVLAKALNRVLAADVFSPEVIPPFNNSAMDGYAVNSDDLKSASKSSPVILDMIGITAAGEAPARPSKTQGTAWKIMTGAAVPSGYDSIVPVENTKKNDSSITFVSPVNLGAHIRSAGEDFMRDQLVLSKNSLINPNRLMALTSLGVAHPSVYIEPRIAVFSTGKELVNNPSQKLSPGQIRNSNQPYILAYLSNLPVDAFDAGTNYDNADEFEKAVQAQLDAGTQIIISTGAVSMGDFDFIPQTIQKLGGTIIFHKVKIRPGKPVLFARFPNGSFYFGLPGNPISATLGLRFFVTHLIRRMVGQAQEKPETVRLNTSYEKNTGFRTLLKAYATINSNAIKTASILQGQESFKIHPLLDANGWIATPEEKQAYNESELVDYYPSIPVFD